MEVILMGSFARCWGSIVLSVFLVLAGSSFAVAGGPLPGLVIQGVTAPSSGGNQYQYQNAQQMQGQSNNYLGSVPNSFVPRSPYQVAPQNMQATTPLSLIDMGNGQTGLMMQPSLPFWFIAMVCYGDPYQWQSLYMQNGSGLQNPNAIPSGQVINMAGLGDVPLGQIGRQQYSAGNQPMGYNPYQQQRVLTQPSMVQQNQYRMAPSNSGAVRRNRSSAFSWGNTSWNGPSRAFSNQYQQQDQRRNRNRYQQQQQGYRQPQQQYRQPQQYQQQNSQGGSFNQVYPVQHGKVTSLFGNRKNPFGGVNTEFHGGLDIGVPKGTPIHSTGDGVVVSASEQGGYGRVVKILHTDGTMTVYAHCLDFQVRKGTRVRAGQQIARANSTGRSTGDHLHFEVQQNGKRIDPKKFFRFPAYHQSF